MGGRLFLQKIFHPFAMKTYLSALLILLVISISPCYASELENVVAFPPKVNAVDTAGNDFKVGLVLSGGGAKGIAHIGVIKALEDHNIPIDCVAGTSAGAIVSSLYACGWSPEQILALFESKDFGYWSTGVINPADIYYFNTPAPTPSWVSVNLSLNDSTFSAMDVIPTNLISPLPMNIEFLRLYSPYSRQCGENFDNLFVPLRTVCSDVYHKHKIVCRDGSLGDAVRASMSFPLVFKPIKMDGVLVYDGGIYDNFPVDVMQEDFNPDFIIGVSVSSPDAKPQEGNVYSQLEDMIIQNNNYSVPAKNGIKIQVPVLDFGVLDFGKAQEIYNIGYRTGMEMVDSVLKRVPYRRSLGEVNARREKFRSQTPVIEFDSIFVQGAKPGQARYLRSLFYGGKKPHPVGIDDVQTAYYRAVTSGKLSDLLPQYKPLEDGTNNLLLLANVKNPWKVGVGGWVTTSTQSMLYLTLGFHTLSFNSLDVDLSGWVGQSYYAGMLAGKMALPTSIPSYVGADIVMSRQKYFNDELLFYQDKTPTFITDNQMYLKLRYCMAMGTKAKATAWLGGALITDKYYPNNVMDYSTAEKDRSHYRTLAFGLDYQYNTLGNQLYPMRGRYLDVNLIALNEGHRYRAGDESHSAPWAKAHPGLSIEGEWKQFFPLHRHFILGTDLHGLVTFQGLYENYTATLVHSPEFAPTPSTRNYFNIGFRSDNYLAAGVMPIWNPISNLQLRGDFYAYSPIRDVVANADGSCRHKGWFRRAEFIGEVAAVYNFSFASLSLYGNYLTYPSRNWNFGISFGLFFQAPRFTR